VVTRHSARFVIALSVVAGWVVVVGIATDLVLYERSEWGGSVGFAAFIIGGSLQDAARRVARRKGWPETVTGSVLWFSQVSRMLFISASDLRVGANAARWSERAVLACVWLPYWLLLAFWVYLALYAFAAFVG
jgi:hypothetical protein